jgi:hypothetical protein
MTSSIDGVSDIVYIRDVVYKCKFPREKNRQMTPAQCWFCQSTENLHQRERASDSAPLEGFECEECRRASREHQIFVELECGELMPGDAVKRLMKTTGYDAKEAQRTVRQWLDALEEDYARHAENDQRVCDAREGFEI